MTDPTPTSVPFAAELSRMFADVKLPTADLESLMASQRRTVEAVAKANQLAVEGLQTAARRQAEIVRGSIEEVTALTRDLIQSPSNEERLARQTEAAKKAIEASLAHIRELSEIIARSSNEAIDVLNRRVAESLDEIRALASPKSQG